MFRVLKCEQGSFTVEAALIVPIIIGIIAFCIAITISRFESSFDDLASTSQQRSGRTVINNTDLAIEAIDFIRQSVVRAGGMG